MFKKLFLWLIVILSPVILLFLVVFICVITGYKYESPEELLENRLNKIENRIEKLENKKGL